METQKQAQAITYTSDPAKVIAVVWNITDDGILDYDDMGEPDEQMPLTLHAARIQHAKALLELKCRQEYPNLERITIYESGYNGEWAQVGDRCETADDSIYEPFFDDMNGWSDEACRIAVETYPTTNEN